MSSNDGNTFGHQVAAYVLAGAMLLFFVGTFIVTVRRCYKQRNDEVQVASDGTLRASVWAAFTEEVARMEERVRNHWLEERKAYIASTLNSKVVAIAENAGRDEANTIVSAAEDEGGGSSIDCEQDPPEQEKDDDESIDQGEISCAICLNRYKDGDVISWSQNRLCRHQFHRQCITEWLLGHEACPCCREVYLSNEPVEASNDKSLPSESRACELGTAGSSARPDNVNQLSARSIHWSAILSGLARTNSTEGDLDSTVGDVEEAIHHESRQV